MKVERKEGQIHSHFVAMLASMLKVNTYLELGVDSGLTFLVVYQIVTRAIGVDIEDNRIIKLGEFYKLPTEVFFKQFKDKVDMVLIDADHRYKHVREDFEYSLKLLNHSGTIIIHDTDPPGENWAAPDLCGDGFNIIEYIKKEYKELDIMTLPIEIGGLSIVRRSNDRRLLEWLNK